MIVSGNVLGDLWDWVVGVFELIGDVSVYVAAFSVAQDSVLMMWNVVLGVALMLWAFGYQETRQLVSSTRRKQSQEQGST